MKYISNEGLENLKYYRYHCDDKSLVAYYIGQPFWRWAVTLLPLWMAPNLVTLIGFSIEISSYLPLLYFCFDLKSHAPSICWIYAAICLFLYQTLDAIDGKQARRTNTSSPLGELFDHGCDAVTTCLMGLSMASMLVGGELMGGWGLLVTMCTTFFTFFGAQWEEFHTDNMYLGYFGVTELLFLTESLYLMTGILGQSIWSQPSFLPFTIGGEAIQYNSLFNTIMFCSGAFTFITNLYNIITYYAKAEQNKENAAQKAKVVTHLLPMISITASAFIWAYISPSDVLRTYPHFFILCTGFCFCFLVGRIVVARVCKMEFSAIQLQVQIPAALALVVCVFLPQYEVAYMYCFLLYAIGNYLVFALIIINQMCDKLNIKCLQIPYDQKAE